MGDRVLFQVVNGSEISPVAYGHWAGSKAPAIMRRLKERMKGREGDVSYTFARLLQEMTAGDDGNLSFGAWNADKVLTAADSHGDAGVVIIDITPKPAKNVDKLAGYGEIKRFHCKCLGGYLKTGKDGLPYQSPDSD